MKKIFIAVSIFSLLAISILPTVHVNTQTNSNFNLDIIAKKNGLWSLTVNEVKNNITEHYRGDLPPIRLASTVKLLAADLAIAEINQGRWTLGTNLEVPTFVIEAGDQSYINNPFRTVKGLLWDMLNNSNNTAYNALVYHLGGPGPNINSKLKKLNYKESEINAYLSIGDSLRDSSSSTGIELMQAMRRITSKPALTHYKYVMEALKEPNIQIPLPSVGFSHLRKYNKSGWNSEALGNVAYVTIVGRKSGQAKNYIISANANINGSLVINNENNPVNTATRETIEKIAETI
jgi:Beta-lactamase enzyme family